MRYFLDQYLRRAPIAGCSSLFRPAELQEGPLHAHPASHPRPPRAVFYSRLVRFVLGSRLKRDDAQTPHSRPITPPPLRGHPTIAVSAWHGHVNTPRRERPRIFGASGRGLPCQRRRAPFDRDQPLLSPPRTRSRAVQGRYCRVGGRRQLRRRGGSRRLVGAGGRPKIGGGGVDLRPPGGRDGAGGALRWMVYA